MSKVFLKIKKKKRNKILTATEKQSKYTAVVRDKISLQQLTFH